MVTYTYYNTLLGCDPLTGGKIKTSNEIIPYFVSEINKVPGFLGIYYASLFSGALSSMSTAYNSTSALIWEDWLRPILKNRLSKRQVLVAVKLICKFSIAFYQSPWQFSVVL